MCGKSLLVIWFAERRQLTPYQGRIDSRYLMTDTVDIDEPEEYFFILWWSKLLVKKIYDFVE